MIKTQNKQDFFITHLKTNPVMLAPLAGVTDLAFRTICRTFGCGMSITEMISAKGLYYHNKNTADLMRTNEEDAPLTGLQIFGNEPALLSEVTAQYLNNTPFSFIDINMGCPMRKIVNNGDGSALMKDPQKAYAVVKSVSEHTSKPVSVKIRLGWDADHINCNEVAAALEEGGASMLTVHGRTREALYSGKADYSAIAQVVRQVHIPVVGNGDVTDLESYYKMKEITGCSGVMIGRGAMGNPFIFQELTHQENVPGALKQATVKHHFNLTLENRPEKIAVAEFRKHLAWYTKGLPKSAKIRESVNHAVTKEAIYDLIDTIIFPG